MFTSTMAHDDFLAPSYQDVTTPMQAIHLEGDKIEFRPYSARSDRPTLEILPIPTFHPVYKLGAKEAAIAIALCDLVHFMLRLGALR